MVVRPHVCRNLLTLVRWTPAWFCLAALLMPTFVHAWQQPKRLADLMEEDESSRIAKLPSKETETWTNPPAHPDVRAASFKGLTPGESNRAAVLKSLGEPENETKDGNVAVLEYQLKPFSKLEIILSGDTLLGIAIHLAEQTDAEELEKELGLNEFAPAPVPDASGEILGIAYPERGILFALAPIESDKDGTKVVQIILEPISAEPFVYRARFGTRHQLLSALADLAQARKLDPKNAEVHWLEAEHLLTAGRLTSGLERIEAAIKLDPADHRFALLKAEILAELDRRDEALAVVNGVLAERADLEPLTRARAECQLGDLLLAGAAPDFEKVIDHHLNAIKLSAPLAADAVGTERASARAILLKAHLSVARDVALGPWNRRDEVVGKWVKQAGEIVDRLSQQDGADGLIRTVYLQKTLETYAVAKANVDLTARTEELLTIGRGLFAATDDAVYQAHLQQRIASALFAAADLQHRQGRPEKTQEYALAALKLLKEALKEREQTPADDHLVGKLLFLVGSSHAIHKKDHPEAIRWFAQAKVYLENGPPRMFAWEAADHGDRLVSMGVSYWQVKQQRQAAEITLAGIQQLESAVKSGNAPEHVLAIPYANYASMQESLGDQNAARSYTAKAQRINQQQGTLKQR